MIYLNEQDTIEGVVVYGDDKKYNKYYLIPNYGEFQRYDNGKPRFNFV